MLSKTDRIPRKSFAELLERSSYSNSDHFSLRYRLSGESMPRVGASVSKKVSKSAVKRNTVRRRVYASIRPYLKVMPKGLFLFVAKAGSDKIKGEAMEKEIRTLLKQAKLIV
jgi:ribonuclease P protein component